MEKTHWTLTARGLDAEEAGILWNVFRCNTGRASVQGLACSGLQCKKETLLCLCQDLMAHAVLRIYKEISKAGPPSHGLSIKLRGD
ncbi:hypothetical protein [Noviherbaspirillum soli]|uniref:hypothetical protein n=1 Tax=Noviherbaspirillum soli TaxID=1064518 RepID=UPI00188C76DA|nr:hypothetical protein [Noviherbaspirillum soli]